jgi:hypothetical protein
VILIVVVVAAIVGVLVQHRRRQAATENAAGYGELDEALEIVQGGLPDPEDEERQQQLQKQEARLEEIISTRAGEQVAIDAGYYLAVNRYRQGRYADAQKGFVEFHRAHKERRPLASMALLGAADALIMQGKLEAADKLLRDSSGAMSGTPQHIQDQALYLRALCEAWQGKADRAQTRVATLLNSSELNEALRARCEALRDQLRVMPADGFAKLDDALPAAADEGGAAADEGGE